MTKALATRLARLEGKRRAMRPRPAVLFRINPDEAPGDVVGMGLANGACIDRAPGEPIAALASRASATCGPRVLIARYAPTAAAPAPQPAVAAPALPGNPEAFPWHLAGIGREDPRYRGWWQPERPD